MKNTDLVIAIDDYDVTSIMRLFNEEEGKEYLKEKGVKDEIIEKLHLLGLSSIANMLMAIKFAKYYELTEDDVVLTVFTDSMEMYNSRMVEQREEKGAYTKEDAIKDYYSSLISQKADNMIELNYLQKKRIHHLKYFTWIEQQARELDELNRQWYDDDYWTEIQSMVEPIDKLIEKFNERVKSI